MLLIFSLCTASLALPVNCTHGDVRLNSASNSDELEGVSGRLEFCFNDAWFVICPGYYWRSYYYYRNERVVCQMLGYATSGTEIQLHSSYEKYFIYI